MKKWRKFTSWRIGDYILQLSVVVLGIIITFAGSSVISGYIESKQVANTMQLIKSELKLNRERVEDIHKHLNFERRACNYILQYRNNLENASEDSLLMYANIPFQVDLFIYVTDALEMLKMSSLSQRIQDKELILQIVKAYNELKRMQEVVNWFYGLKSKYAELIFTDVEFQKGGKKWEGNEKENIRNICRYHLDNLQFVNILEFTSTGVNYESSYLDSKEALDQAIAMIEKKYSHK